MAINENGVQVERQYIGARYVPKFFQGVNGSPEWVAGLSYEPLTVVTYLGNSFTSKVPVPAGIGNPAANPSYWVNTGNYNAQVDAYRDIVEQYKEAVTAVQTQVDKNTEAIENINFNTEQNRRFVFIGDSYNTDSTPAGGQKIVPWGKALGAKLGLSTSNYFSFGESGYGWVAGRGYLTILQNNVNSITDPNTITDIFVLGGINDVNAELSEISNAIDAFATYALNIMPNATITIGFISWSSDVKCKTLAINLQQLMQRKVSSKINFMANGFMPLHWYPYIQSDGIHPTAAGTEALVAGIVNYIKTGSNIQTYRAVDSVTLIDKTLPWSNLAINLEQVINGETLNIKPVWTTTQMAFTAKTISVGLNEQIGTYSGTLAKSTAITTIAIGDILYVTDTNAFYGFYKLLLLNNQVWIGTQMRNSLATTVSNVKEVYISNTVPYTTAAILL